MVYKYDCYIVFFIILFGIKQLNKLWKKTFKNIYQLSCFVGHPVPAGLTTKNEILMTTLNSLKMTIKMHNLKKNALKSL